MSEEQRGKRPALVERVLPDEALASFISIGRQLSVQMAQDSFKYIMKFPGWTSEHLEYVTEKTLLQIETAARDALLSKGGNPDGEQWHKVWAAMEGSYREATEKLLAAAEPRKGGVIQ